MLKLARVLVLEHTRHWPCASYILVNQLVLSTYCPSRLFAKDWGIVKSERSNCQFLFHQPKRNINTSIASVGRKLVYVETSFVCSMDRHTRNEKKIKYSNDHVIPYHRMILCRLINVFCVLYVYAGEQWNCKSLSLK